MRKLLSLICLPVLLVSHANGQGVFTDIGFTQLQAQVGPGLENGAGVRASLVEAPVLPNDAFFPDTSDPQFSGKTIVNGSPAAPNAGPSQHATGVGQIFFGNTASIASGITDVTAYEANDWIANILGAGSNRAPSTQDFRVQNHSYVGYSDATAAVAEINRRFDFMIQRDNITAVVALNNGAGAPLPNFLSQSFNAISVGMSNGDHSFGLTTAETAGRTKPDIVAPATSTSNATPMVSSVAAVLHQRANNMGAAGADATRNEVMKAIIMAGATKNEPEFITPWTHTATQPLDAVHGAGEVNVFNSYNILSAGQFDGSTAQPTGLIGMQGWDYESNILPNTTMAYNLRIPDDQAMTEGTVLLTWNSVVTDQDPSVGFNPVRSTADLTVRFFDSSTAYLGTELDASLSQVDNVELLWLKNLNPGLYTIQVSTNAASSYGLAWTFAAVPEPSTVWLIGCAAAIGGAIYLRRRAAISGRTVTASRIAL